MTAAAVKEEDEEIQRRDASSQLVGAVERAVGAPAKRLEGVVLRLMRLQHADAVDALLDVRSQGAVGESRPCAPLAEAGREGARGDDRGEDRDQEQEAEVGLEKANRDQRDSEVGEECDGLDQGVLHHGGHHGAVLVDAVDRVAHRCLVVVAQRQVRGAVHHRQAQVLIHPLQDPGEVVADSGTEQEAAGHQGARHHEEHRSQREPCLLVEVFDVDEPRRIQAEQACLGA